MANPPLTQPPAIGFVSLGCPKALVDSERILTCLRAEGYVISPSYDGAELVIVNTCGFIDEAKAESLEAIGEALTENGRVIVTGCLGKDAQMITERYPDVLAVSGPHAYETVMQAVHEHVPPQHSPFEELVPPQGVRLTPRHYAYLKISEGCNHHCTFCIIPELRGPLVSRPIGEVMDEAQRLADAGVRELLVISQDTSAYGSDLRYQPGFWNARPLKTRFADLAAALSELGIWIRLHYVYPYPHVDEVIPLMAEGKILPYLDVPFQHASPRILKAMQRPAAAEKTLQRVLQWRQACPDLTIRSTFIVGFPGETEADFEQLLSFLQQAQLDRVGCFQYSPVAGARANELPGHVPDEIKQERFDRLMSLQARISADRLQQKIGRQMTVLVDGLDPQQRLAIARSPADAPEIDGLVYIEEVDGGLNAGDFADVEVHAASDHDLFARLL